MNYYAKFYDRNTVLPLAKRLRRRKQIKNIIKMLREWAFSYAGCEEQRCACQFPECFCYPYWESKYRPQIEAILQEKVK